MGHSILICDDEPEIRTVMRRTLRGYEVVESASPREALEILTTRTFDAVISDLSLEAERDGLEFLHSVRELYPTMIRVLVTGNREVESVLATADDALVHRYFRKPWDNAQLRAAVALLLTKP